MGWKISFFILFGLNEKGSIWRTDTAFSFWIRYTILIGSVKFILLSYLAFSSATASLILLAAS